MIFTKIVCELEESNLTQAEIASEVGSKQTNISAIKSRGTVPNFFLGEKLIRLHAERCPDSELIQKVG